MRITRFEVEGFRSIRKLVLEPGEVAVFYGPNGSGKSNILAAIDRFWKVWRLLLDTASYTIQQCPVDAAIFAPDDFNRGDNHGLARLSATLVLEEGDAWFQGEAVQDIEIGLVLSESERGKVTASVGTLSARTRSRKGVISKLVLASKGPKCWWQDQILDHDEQRQMWADWSETAGPRFGSHWLFVPELRGSVRAAAPAGSDVSSEAPVDRLTRLALDGHFEEAVFFARNSPDLALEERLDALRKLLQAAPLHRPDFRPAVDNNRYLLQEIIEVEGRRHAIPLDLAGLGVRQLYAILGAIVLSGAPIVAIEEPEAHLHERTTALQLRQVLRKLVPGTISQLFVATHSTVFDLDPTGYFDVCLDPALGTVVERRTDLVDLDLRHLYRPGPARHALLDALRDAEPDRVVAHRPDGTPVKASEMIEMLVVDDPDALAFLDAVTASAVRAVTLKENRRA